LDGSAFTGVKAISAGGKHTLAIAADDTVWAWGDNASGQLGDGTLVKEKSPVHVLADAGTTLAGVTAIAAGGNFSLALKSDGTVWAWGNNGKGQLGDNSHETSRKAKQVQMLVTKSTDPKINDIVAPLEGITAIAAGGSHALALKGDGTIYAWGYNEFGQLGDGTITSSKSAVKVVTDKIATAISAGLDHSAAIVGSNVYTWGYNYYGQLGNGAELASNIPVRTLQSVVVKKDGTALTGIVEIIATGYHCIARDSNGAIWTWGRNTHGQLGNGTTITRSIAEIIPDL